MNSKLAAALEQRFIADFEPIIVKIVGLLAPLRRQHGDDLVFTYLQEKGWKAILSSAMLPEEKILPQRSTRKSRPNPAVAGTESVIPFDLLINETITAIKEVSPQIPKFTSADIADHLIAKGYNFNRGHVGWIMKEKLEGVRPAGQIRSEATSRLLMTYELQGEVKKRTTA